MDNKLIKVQAELKAPKGQFNNFGKYKYRSCEDILESVKPLLKETESQLTLSDEIVAVGDRIYVKATATFKGDEETSVTAYAREPLDKKGMDTSQITGTASSYARKYALNGLFLIDDTKDADTDEYKKTTQAKSTKKEYTKSSREQLIAYVKANTLDIKKIGEQYGLSPESDEQKFKEVLEKLKKGE